MSNSFSGFASTERTEMLINNEEVRGNDYFQVCDPGRTSDVVGIVATSTARNVDAAVEAAFRAGKIWAGYSIDQRIELLSRAAEILQNLSIELGPLLTRENGAVLREALMDMSRGAELFVKTLNLAKPFLQRQLIDNDQHWLSIEKRPVGVTALLVPWNSPMVLTMGKLAPALVAGNTVVLKPSPYAPVTLTRCLKEMAQLLPPGVINVVNGDVEVGQALLSHPKVRKISFTGSISTGREVMKLAASTIKNVSLELGGNDPAIILDDVDLSEIMPRLCQGIFMRAGQICFAVKRIYVPKTLYDDFYQAMCAEVNRYKIGHGLDERTTFGPLINANQLNFVTNLVERTKATGATVTELGVPVDPNGWENGYYMLPKVVHNIQHRSELVAIEQFAPVIPLVPYDTVDEAIDLANDSEFGLSSSVWSSDFERALNVSGHLEAGGTFINSHNLWSLSLDMPMGGVKQSGIGRERSELGLQQYVEDHAIRLVK